MAPGTAPAWQQWLFDQRISQPADFCHAFTVRAEVVVAAGEAAAAAWEQLRLTDHVPSSRGLLHMSPPAAGHTVPALPRPSDQRLRALPSKMAGKRQAPTVDSDQ